MTKIIEVLNTYEKEGYNYDYVLLDNGKTKLVMEHRRLWEQVFGPITRGNQLHHVDHNRKNNDLSNLISLPGWLHTLAFHNIQDIVSPRSD